MSSKVVESEFYGFENVSANSKVLSEFRHAMKRKFNSEKGNVNHSPHRSLQTSSSSRRKDLRKIGFSSKSKDKSGPLTTVNMKTSAPPSVLSNPCQISGNSLTLTSTKAVVNNGQLKHVDIFPNTKENPTLPIKEHSAKTVNKTLKTAKLRLKPLNINLMNQRLKSAEVVIQPLKYNALNRCSSEETETVISGGVEYSLSFIDGKHKITEKQKRTKANQRKKVKIAESVTSRHVEPLASSAVRPKINTHLIRTSENLRSTINDIMELDADEVTPKLCDTSVEMDFQPRNKLRDFSCQTIQTDVIKIKTEILESPEVSNCGVQTDAQMLKMVSDFSCQTMFPDPMSESLSSAMEFRGRIIQLEQSLQQSRQEATKREKVLKKFEAKVKNLEQNLAKSQKRTEVCQMKIDTCDKCSGRCDETTSTSIETPFNKWTSTPMQLRAQTPSSSLRIIQNMLQSGMTTTPMISPMLPTSNSTSRGEIVPFGLIPQTNQPSTPMNSPLLPSSNSISQGEIIPYGLIPQTNQPSTSFGLQNMSQNATTTSLVNSPQPTSIAPNLISRSENAPYNFMPPQPMRMSPMCTPPEIMFSGVPQRLIVGHNVGQYNFQQALQPNQSLTSHQQFSQQQHPHSLPMTSVQNQQLLHQNINCACVQCFQQRHQQLPSLPQNRSNKHVQRETSYNQQLRQQQLSQQQVIQHQQAHRKQLQSLRQDLHQQQSHQQELVQQPVVKQRKGTERQAIERLEQAVLESTKKFQPKKVSVKKYLLKKD